MTVATSAEAQIPACPNEEDGVLTFEPGYVRIGHSYSVRMSVRGDRSASTISAANVETDGAVTPLDVSDGSAKAIIGPPEGGAGHLRIVFAWDQDVGTSAACHGTDTYDVSVIPSRARAGRSSATRLSGRYRVRFTPLGLGDKPSRATWTLTPRCDYFACSARLRSSGGASGTLRLLGDGTYRYNGSGGRSGVCTVRNGITGEVKRYRPAYVVHVRFTVRVAAQRRGVASRLSGKATFEYQPTSAADAAGCDSGTSEEKISAARL